MIKEKNKIQKNSLDLKGLTNTHLSIQFSLDGFSFCVLDKEANTFVALNEYNFTEKGVKNPQNLLTNIADVFDTNDLLKHTFNSVTISHVNDLSSFVPKPLFDENKLSSYVEFNNKTFKHDFYAFDELGDHDMVNVYIPFVNVNNFFIDQFGGFEYKHFSTILVENLLNTYKYSVAPNMFVNICDSHFEIIVIFDKKLQLYNTFKFATKEDFIYYILFTAEQLNINPEEFELRLLGKVEKDDEYYTIAYKYVRNVSLIENRSNHKYDESFTESMKRHYFMLFHQL